jgi:hypothetical protein
MIIYQKDLQEQIYSRRVYYHGSPNKFNQFRDNITFLAPNKNFAIAYSFERDEDNIVNEIYLYTVIPLKPLNIFNPYSRKDKADFIVNAVQFNINGHDATSYVDLMTDRKLYWGLMEHRDVVDLLKKMGFDGVTVTEKRSDKDEYNIGVFNIKNIRIAKTEIVPQSIYDDLVRQGLTGRG